MLIDILRGSKNEKIRRFGFDSLSTWGIMQDISARRIRLIIDFLIDEGYLISLDDEYPVVALGNTNELFKEGQRVLMKLPEEQKKISRQKNLPLSAESADKKQSDAQNSSAEIDEELFEILRKHRKEIAAKEAVPAYIIFSDASLKDMSRKKPVSPAQFSAISGVGSVKLEKYGEDFVSLIKKYIAEN